jgi:hypothetical protein
MSTINIGQPAKRGDLCIDTVRYYERDARCQQISACPGHGRNETCPMRPEIERDAADSCPICGIALEPMLPSLGEDEATGPRFWSDRLFGRGSADFLSRSLELRLSIVVQCAIFNQLDGPEPQ